MEPHWFGTFKNMPNFPFDWWIMDDSNILLEILAPLLATISKVQSEKKVLNGCILEFELLLPIVLYCTFIFTLVFNVTSTLGYYDVKTLSGIETFFPTFTTNYVEMILAFFDHLPPCVDIFLCYKR